MAERKSLQQQLADYEAKAARLRTKLAADARKLDARQKIIIGGTVIEAMKADPNLHATVTQLLQRKVTRAADREAIADWLTAPASPEPPPAQIETAPPAPQFTAQPQPDTSWQSTT